MDPVQINQYLWCGFLPPREFPAWVSGCMTPESIGREYSLREAAERFDILFDALVELAPSGRHIIPLSGGWDSRAILGALLERIDSDQITTVTFGVPGHLDYDLGKIVADLAGVNHHTLDLRSIDFTWETLRESVLASPWAPVPDVMFNSFCRNLVSSTSDTIWSGFLGDALTGLQPSDMSMTYDEKTKKFSEKLRRSKSQQIHAIDFNPDEVCRSPQNLPANIIDHEKIQRSWHVYCVAFSEAPIVTPTEKWDDWGALIGKERNGARVIAPFADSAWGGYWLAAPRKVRKGQNLYVEMLNLKFPKLFSLPGKINYGTRWSHGVHAMIQKWVYIFRSQMQARAPQFGIRSSLMANYLDYNEMFRNREDYQATLGTAFEYLRDNQVVPWLDLDMLWEEHMRRRKDHGDAFCVLLGLAANCVENPLE